MEGIINKIKNKNLFKDSIWAILGNGLGSGLMLIAGIFIARFLGKDLYGEYGIVKSTMFYIATFATLGIGVTSTRYIAQFVKDKNPHINNIIRDCTIISLVSSSLIALLIILFAKSLSNYLDTPQLVSVFRYLGIIIICRAFVTTQIGILAGYKKFKIIARNNVCAGLFMLVVSIPMTRYLSLNGALISLLSSQLFNVFQNYLSLKQISRHSSNSNNESKNSYIKELLKFSIPVALQESSYSICNWLGMIILVKLSSPGEYGIYSAASQWGAIISFIPSVLYNVMLSHLSSHFDNYKNQASIMKTMLFLNLMCAAIPCGFVILFSNVIANVYGPSFIGLKDIIVYTIIATIFLCCSNVYRAEFTAMAKNWIMFFVRFGKDILLLILAYIFIKKANGVNGAMIFTQMYVITSFIYFVGLTLLFLRYKTEVSSKKWHPNIKS